MTYLIFLISIFTTEKKLNAQKQAVLFQCKSSYFLKQIPVTLKISGHLFFGVLFIFSFLFYKERHAFDAAHYLFEIITRKGFYIAHGRLIGFVSQLMPLIGIYSNASLKSLMLLYSFGDVLYYYVIFLIAAYVIKSQAAIISVLLFVCLAVKFTFYCPVTELLQAMVLLPLLYEALIRFDRFKFHVIPLLLFLIVFSHPLLFILVGFVIIYFIAQQKEKWFSKQNIFLFSVFILITAAKFLLLDKYDYQKTFYPVVFDDYSNVKNITDQDFIISFLIVYFKENFLVGLFWIVTLMYLIANKKFLQLTIAFFAPLSFLLLITITHSFTTISNYSERMLLPFAGMIIISFSLSFPEIKNVLIKKILLVFLVFSLGFRLCIIYDAAFPYTKRVAQIEELIHKCHQQNITKAIVDERNLEYLPYAMTGWSYPLESLLLSSIRSKDSAVTIALKEEQYQHFDNRDLAPKEIYKTQDSIINYSVLNKKYFKLTPSHYAFLNNQCGDEAEKISSIIIVFNNHQNIKPDNEYCYLNTTIINHGSALCSDVDGGYQIQLNTLSENDSAYRDSRIISFQTDVIKELNQDLVFKNYGMDGKWKLNVSVIDKNKKIIAGPFITSVYIE